MRKLLFMDLETTGLDDKNNDVIELGFVLVVNKEVIKEFDIQVQPVKVDQKIVTFQNQYEKKVEYKFDDLVPVQLSNENKDIVHMKAGDMKALDKFKIKNVNSDFTHEIDGYYTKIESRQIWRPFQPGAMRTHGITEQQMKKFKSPDFAVRKIEKELSTVRDGEKFILCGHNMSGFDKKFFRSWLHNCNGFHLEGWFEKSYEIDTLAMARILKSHGHLEVGRLGLGSLCKHFGIKLERAHRALDDIKANVELYFELENIWNMGKSADTVEANQLSMF